ncbi:DUF6253 family protein [Streptomyces sp. 900105755]
MALFVTDEGDARRDPLVRRRDDGTSVHGMVLYRAPRAGCRTRPLLPALRPPPRGRHARTAYGGTRTGTPCDRAPRPSLIIPTSWRGNSGTGTPSHVHGDGVGQPTRVGRSPRSRAGTAHHWSGRSTTGASGPVSR